MRRVLVLVACLIVSLSAAPGGQQRGGDAEMDKLVKAFEAAWAKGDAKAIAALHTTDAIRVSPDGQIAVGRAAIEQSMAMSLAGPFKGSKLMVTQGKSGTATENFRIESGTWEVSGGTPPPGTPTKGSYVNALVRQGGQWLIANSGVVGMQPGS